MSEAVVDILKSQLEAATEALQQCQERSAAGQLALEVMHEIRNPLEALGHLNHLAMQDAENPEMVREHLRMADEQMSTVERVARRSLDFAKSPTESRQVLLMVLAESALRIHKRRIERKNIHLVKKIPEALEAQLFSGEMLQVLSNLIANAVDALPERGTLYVRIRKCHGHIHMIVADNGCGVPLAERDSVFEPFFTTKRDRGTGLGLSLCKKIIEHHEGKIRMRSSVSPKRHGTAFRITLPHRLA